MANEISVTSNCSITSAGQNVGGSGSFTANLSSLNFLGQEVTIGSATAATIPIGGLATPAIVYIKNLDATNFITVDALAALTAFPQKILPGQAICLLPTSGTIYAKANAANCQAWVVAG